MTAVHTGLQDSETARPTAPVETTCGPVRGLRSNGVTRFRGIPYGEDTGRHRFKPPRPPQPWADVRDCFALGPKAPQGVITISGVMGKVSPDARALQVLMAVQRATDSQLSESENCLVLNVITPDASPGGKRPVMVWLHGGGFAMGSGMDAMTDGSALARCGDVVVVSLNHRLNALGYLYLGALHDDFADSGNCGQLDIVLALEWVRDNIAAFGGDPGNVTVFGESGGGAKVGTLLGMTPARGLFRRAIEQSGPAVRLVTRDDAAAIAERTLAALGVAKTDVHQLQALDYKAVISAASQVRLPSGGAGITERGLAPVVDGRSIPAHPFDRVATDLSRDIPLMIGTCKDEATLFMAGDPELGNMSQEEARQRFEAVLGANAQGAFDAYRDAGAGSDPSYWVTSLMTDRMFRADSIIAAERKSDQGAAPVFMYRVDYEPRVVDRLLRSPHGTDVPLMFGTLVPPEFIGTGPDVDALSQRMMGAWINFARTGNPSQTGLDWARYDRRERQTMIFDVPCRLLADPDPIARNPVVQGKT